MTRTDGKDSTGIDKDQKASMGHILQVAIAQALEQGRLISGVHDCAQLLEIDPFNAMICVLPESTEEDDATDSPTPTDGVVSTQIYHMLIEALCREYDIRVIKVDSLAKLAKVVHGHNLTANGGVPLKRSVSTADVNCLLLQYPQQSPSVEDEKLAEFYKSSLFTEDPQPCVIGLPD